MAQKKNYFDEMEDTAKTVCHMAEKMTDVFSGKLSVQKAAETVKKDTAGISRIKNTVAEKLDRDFLPPIDREDISLLMQSLEDISFAVKDTVMSVYATGASAGRKSAVLLSSGIYEYSRLLYIALASLKNGSGKVSLAVFSDMGKTLDSITGNYDIAIKNLFETNKDALKTAVWIKIFDCLHRTAYRCKKAADTLEYVILKNS